MSSCSHYTPFHSSFTALALPISNLSLLFLTFLYFLFLFFLSLLSFRLCSFKYYLSSQSSLLKITFYLFFPFILFICLISGCLMVSKKCVAKNKKYPQKEGDLQKSASPFHNFVNLQFNTFCTLCKKKFE
jgi:hypothetical protein